MGLRNFLFLKDILPDPSIFTLYWLNGRTSTTVPDLSHLRGWGPDWFCTMTTFDTVSMVSSLVCSVSRSSCFTCLLARASSLLSLVSNYFCLGW